MPKGQKGSEGSKGRINKESLVKLGNLENLRRALPTFIPNLTTLLKLTNIPPSSQQSANFLSEGVRLGLSQKNPPRDSTKKYSPWGITFGMGRE